MYKKLILRKVILGGILSFLFSFLIYSCTKKETPSEFQTTTVNRVLPPDEDPPTSEDTNYVNYFSQYFLNDYSFALVIDKFGNNAIDMATLVNNQGGLPLVSQYGTMVSSYSSYSQFQGFCLQNGIDTSAMLNEHAEILGSVFNLNVSNPQFYNLDYSSQLSVITNVLNTLDSEDFRANNPNSPVVIAYNLILDRVAASGNIAARLTMDEVEDCLKDAIIGGIASTYNTVRQLWSVLTGYNLGWGGMVNVAKSALRSIIGSSAAGALVTFGLCIAWEIFW